MAPSEAGIFLQWVAPDREWEFQNTEDRIRWRWGSSGAYSSKSVYKQMVEGGKVISRFEGVWKAKVPPMVRTFGYLMLRGKILTRDVLHMRHIQCEWSCVMCSGQIDETLVHLVFLCPYVWQVWSFIQRQLGVRLIMGVPVQGSVPVTCSFRVIWERSRRLFRGQQGFWICWMLNITWGIWRQRNNLVFRDKTVPPLILANRLWQDGNLWWQHC